MHNIISEYYIENPTWSFTIFYQMFKEEMNKASNDVMEIFRQFRIYNNSENATELIKHYTGDILYKILIIGY